MPEIVTVLVPVRGHTVAVEIVQDDSPATALATHVEMLTLALAALGDPRVDAVLAAFGFEIRIGKDLLVFKPLDSTEPVGYEGVTGGHHPAAGGSDGDDKR